MRLKCTILALVLFSLSCGVTRAQAHAAPAASDSQVSALSNGVKVSNGELHEQITALRDDVLRIRMWRGDTPPEDASWAVLAAVRHASVPVTEENAGGHAGFRTHDLAVDVDTQTLEFIVRDHDGNIVEQDAQPVRFDGSGFRIYKAMPRDEHYFGLGDKTGPLDRRNEAFTLWNTDAYRFQESTDPIYKSIPYFMAFRAGKATGLLLDNTWRSSFDFGKESESAYSFGAPNGPLDYYFFNGPSPRRVVETYAWLTGLPPLPPLWSFGFQQSRYSYMTQARVLEVANRFRTDHIPADAIYLDIDYQEKNRPFTVNRTAFPDLAGMIAQLKAENFHVVLITDLHIANLPNSNYAPFDSGMDGNHFVKNLDGSVYSGKVWPGPSVFPDFTRQQTRAWWGTLYRDFHRDGADGFWNDMNEPSIFDSPTATMPEDVVHRIDEPGFANRAAPHAEIHNVYGMENSRATFDGLRTLDPDTRPFVLTRATYAGGQRYAATWTGDNSSSWNHMRLATPMLKNLGLSGFAFSGADVGGFAGTPSTELLTKWLEVGSFQPIDRDHTEKGTGDQEPWVGGQEQEAIRRRFIETRYRLMPYIYTIAEEASRTGVPMVRPLFLDFPDATADRHPIDLDTPAAGEFLFGGDLLVAPPPFPDELDDYAAELPSASWYDFWTGKRVGTPPADPDPAGPPQITGVSTVHITPTLAELPVFVRGGSILPIAPLTESTNETPKGPLTLRIYAGDGTGRGSGDPCHGELYLDDGKSYGYEHGNSLRVKFSCQVTNEGLQVHIGAHEGVYPAWWTEIRAEVYGWKPAKGTVSVEGVNDSAPIASDAEGVSFQLHDDGKGVEVLVR